MVNSGMWFEVSIVGLRQVVLAIKPEPVTDEATGMEGGRAVSPARLTDVEGGRTVLPAGPTVEGGRAVPSARPRGELEQKWDEI